MGNKSKQRTKPGNWKQIRNMNEARQIPAKLGPRPIGWFVGLQPKSHGRCTVVWSSSKLGTRKGAL